jgi:type IX secretion system PorP/SprF family membrane protein
MIFSKKPYHHWLKGFSIAILIFSTSNSFVAQQDFLNSQYMFNLQNINPAYTGSKDVLSASLSHRSQWVGFEGAPSTQVLSVHAPITKLKIGVGLQIFNDVIGPRQMNGINTSYAYHLRLGKGKIGLGLRAGIINYTYNWSELNYKDVQDVVIGQGKQAGLVANFDFGSYYKDKLQFAGIELAHLATPTISTTNTEMNLKIHLTGFYGRAFELSNKLVLKSSVLTRTSEVSGFVDINASLLINKKIWTGLTYRTAGAIILMADYFVTSKLRIGYSYDYYFNGLSTSQNGSHEIFIGFDIDIFKNNMLSPRYF